MINGCGHWHPPTKAVCERCHHKIYQEYGRNWFSCPNHMACCYRGQLPTGADLGVDHVPFVLASTTEQEG